MQGHCWFALRVGNAAWHTVNSVARGTHLRSREGKRRRLNKLSDTDSRLLIYGIQSLLSHVYTVCFTNTLTKPPTSGYEVEVVKHKLTTTLAKFMLQWERRGAFTSSCYLNSLKVWSAGKKKVGLNEARTPRTERTCAMQARLGSVFMQVVGTRSKTPQGEVNCSLDRNTCFFKQVFVHI